MKTTFQIVKTDKRGEVIQTDKDKVTTTKLIFCMPVKMRFP